VGYKQLRETPAALGDNSFVAVAAAPNANANVNANANANANAQTNNQNPYQIASNFFDEFVTDEDGNNGDPITPEKFVNTTNPIASPTKFPNLPPNSNQLANHNQMNYQNECEPANLLLDRNPPAPVEKKFVPPNIRSLNTMRPQSAPSKLPSPALAPTLSSPTPNSTVGSGAPLSSSATSFSSSTVIGNGGNNPSPPQVVGSNGNSPPSPANNTATNATSSNAMNNLPSSSFRSTMPPIKATNALYQNFSANVRGLNNMGPKSPAPFQQPLPNTPSNYNHVQNSTLNSISNNLPQNKYEPPQKRPRLDPDQPSMVSFPPNTSSLVSKIDLDAMDVAENNLNFINQPLVPNGTGSNVLLQSDATVLKEPSYTRENLSPLGPSSPFAVQPPMPSGNINFTNSNVNSNPLAMTSNYSHHLNDFGDSFAQAELGAVFADELALGAGS